MAISGVLLLTLFTGLCVSDSKTAATPQPSKSPSISSMRLEDGNLALNGRAVQSSLRYIEGDAHNAVNGNADTDFNTITCTHTRAESNPWWRVDLGNVYSVSNVTITNRGDCCKERITGAQIRIGKSLENNGNNNKLAATVLTAFDGTQTFSFDPINGRYVNIVLPVKEQVLTLCEVEVFAVTDEPFYTLVPSNLAIGAKAVQSSTYPLSGAQNAINGNWNPIFSLGSCSSTNGDKNPWWRVDLFDAYKIARVSITNRGDCCAERINGVQIRIGNSLENNGNDNMLAATVDTIPAGERKTFVFNPINGRFVNIFLPGRREFLTLCEVEVFVD